jgi:DNA-binding transcriptional LysR family regulator
MKTDLDSIAVFVSVVNRGSFSAAARELSLTPSAISKRIASLEDGLGVSLMRRTTRKIALTEAGQEFFESCSRSLSAISEAEETLSRFSKSPYGLLRIRVPQVFGRLHIAPAIPTFMMQHPQIQVDLSFVPLARDFIEEKIDVCVASSDPPDGNLVARKLAPFERVICAAHSYIERCGLPSSVGDLARHNCLIFAGSDTSNHDEWELRGKNGMELVKVSGSFRTNDADSLYMAVLAGVGLAQMPTFVVGPALASGELTAVLRNKRDVSGAYMKAYFPRAKHRLPKVRAFIDYLVGTFQHKEWSGSSS